MKNVVLVFNQGAQSLPRVVTYIENNYGKTPAELSEYHFIIDGRGSSFDLLLNFAVNRMRMLEDMGMGELTLLWPPVPEIGNVENAVARVMRSFEGATTWRNSDDSTLSNQCVVDLITFLYQNLSTDPVKIPGVIRDLTEVE